jgi:hypothetical protein
MSALRSLPAQMPPPSPPRATPAPPSIATKSRIAHASKLMFWWLLLHAVSACASTPPLSSERCSAAATVTRLSRRAPSAVPPCPAQPTPPLDRSGVGSTPATIYPELVLSISAARDAATGPACSFCRPPFSRPPPGSPAYPLPQHLHELWLSLHGQAVLETLVRARLPARQTLPGLAELLDDMGRRIIGHVVGHDNEKGHVVGCARWSACSSGSSAMPWTVASIAGRRATSSSPPPRSSREVVRARAGRTRCAVQAPLVEEEACAARHARQCLRGSGHWGGGACGGAVTCLEFPDRA